MRAHPEQFFAPQAAPEGGGFEEPPEQPAFDQSMALDNVPAEEEPAFADPFADMLDDMEPDPEVPEGEI